MPLISTTRTAAAAATARRSVLPHHHHPLHHRGFAHVADNVTTPSSAPGAINNGVEVPAFLLEDVAANLNAEELKKVPQFTISRKSGFLPREDPLVTLPPAFSTLDSLLNRMTIKQYDHSTRTETGPGLLALNQFGDAVHDELRVGGPEFEAVDKVIASGDQRLASALFRDYCFATSAYLLEPTDVSFRKTGLYAPGKDVLPAQIAVPLKKLADFLGHFPFMEYASSCE